MPHQTEPPAHAHGHTPPRIVQGPAHPGTHQIQILNMRYPVSANQQPRWLTLDGFDGDAFLPLFSDDAMFQTCCASLGLSTDPYGVVTDGFSFVQSIPRRLDGYNIRIVIDLQIRDGSVWFLELQRPPDDSVFLPAVLSNHRRQRQQQQQGQQQDEQIFLRMG